MGKQTLNHPVPLSVLRGSLEYCGWKFSALKCVGEAREGKSVAYRISELKPPQDAPRMDAQAIKHYVQKCFTGAIKVDLVQTDSNGKITAWILVHKRKHIDDAIPSELPADLPF
jgi:hypothetical protein